MSDTQEQPLPGATPAPPVPDSAPPEQTAPAATTAAAPAAPVAARSRRGLLEWFWRGQAIARAAESGVFVPPRARELKRRADLAAELGRRALEPSGVIAPGAGDAIACELYREALYWALASLAVTRGDPALARQGDLATLLRSTDRGVLLAASAEPDALGEIEAAVGGASFVDFAELSSATQRELAWKLRRFVEALLGALDSVQVQIDRQRLKRFVRVGFVLLFGFVLIPVSLLMLDWREQQRDLARGKPWKASSAHQVQACVSPAQKCPETPAFFFHTTEEDSPWLMLDLGSKKQFSAVRVANRTDCCPELAVPLAIEASSDKKEWKQLAVRRETFDVWKATFPDVKARYVRVRALRRTFLVLAEVRVLR